MNGSSYEIRSINDYDESREELGAGKTFSLLQFDYPWAL
jgi:hypothetical protein